MEDAEHRRPFEHRRLLVVSTNYAPELTGIGPYAAQLAEHWAASGADTHVLTGMPHYPAWRTDAAYRGVWRTEERREGVTVHRRRHYVPARQSALRRAAFEASVWRTDSSPRPECVPTRWSPRCPASPAASSAPAPPAASGCRTSRSSRT